MNVAFTTVVTRMAVRQWGPAWMKLIGAPTSVLNVAGESVGVKGGPTTGGVTSNAKRYSTPAPRGNEAGAIKMFVMSAGALQPCPGGLGRFGENVTDVRVCVQPMFGSVSIASAIKAPATLPIRLEVPLPSTVPKGWAVAAPVSKGGPDRETWTGGAAPFETAFPSVQFSGL